jgi:hypothetical protein
MALCGDMSIVPMGSCLPLGITYPCFTRDGNKRKAAKGLRTSIGALCGIKAADHSLNLNTAIEVNFLKLH